MEIQWSLVLFSALAGAGGWILAGLAVDEVKGRNTASHFNAGLVALIVMLVGGVCSATHLSHPDRMLGALSHPTSDIFYEAALLGIAAICTVVYLVLVKRDGSAGARKGFIVIAAIIGVLLSFVSGLGYAVMAARYSWNTPLLPLGYLATSIPTGLAAYTVVALAADAKADVALPAKGIMAGGIIAVIVCALYAFVSGTAASDPLVMWGLVVVVGGIVPAVLGAMIAKNPEGALPKAACALVCALVGSIAFRCFMWMTTIVVANLFLQL